MLPTFDIPIFWIILFLVLITCPVILLARLAYRGAPDGRSRYYAILIIAIYLSYFVGISIAERYGWFSENTFPAKIILFATIPYAILLFGFVWNSRPFQALSERLTTADFVEVHLFRVVGGFFIVLVLLETLPAWFGIIAGVGDLMAALGSIWVSRSLKRDDPNAKKWAKIWNSFGLIDILFTAVAANVLTKLALENGGNGVAVLAQFPFLLIPAFAPPTIIFLHLIIYKKLAS